MSQNIKIYFCLSIPHKTHIHILIHMHRITWMLLKILIQQFIVFVVVWGYNL